MKPLFEFPDDETEAKKQDWKQKLLKYKEIIKAKKSVVVAEAQKAYKVFRCFGLSNSQTQWDRIVRKIHTKDPWISLNINSNKGPCVRSWLSFQDCIKLHRLIVVPVDAAEKHSSTCSRWSRNPNKSRYASTWLVWAS